MDRLAFTYFLFRFYLFPDILDSRGRLAGHPSRALAPFLDPPKLDSAIVLSLSSSSSPSFKSV